MCLADSWCNGLQYPTHTQESVKLRPTATQGLDGSSYYMFCRFERNETDHEDKSCLDMNSLWSYTKTKPVKHFLF